MITTRISIKAHLEEYLTGRYANCRKNPIQFPDGDDLYHLIFDLMSKRPINCGDDKTGLEIYLPERSVGKDPQYYNYLGYRAQRIIERKVETLFWAELHDLIDHNKHRHGIEYTESVFTFMNRYGIESISEDALLKNYYRWRDKVRKRDKRREYRRSVC